MPTWLAYTLAAVIILTGLSVAVVGMFALGLSGWLDEPDDEEESTH